LPPQIIDAAFAPARENDGGTRAQALAFVGREDLAGPDYRPVCAGLSVDPITEIVRQSVGHRVVIINEAHDAPRDRAFIADLATCASPRGFLNLCGRNSLSSHWRYAHLAVDQRGLVHARADIRSAAAAHAL
jgi:hypothetical protein